MSTTSLTIVRNGTGELRYRGELPERHVFSRGYVDSGGIEAVVAEARALARNGEDTSHLNLTAICTRDGSDLVFPFVTGEVRYRYVGPETDDDGVENPDALVYELIDAGATP